jgi:dihydroflavonol-4-reductase
MMRVAVTGAAGHVGINLVDALVRAGHEVVAIDKCSPPTSFALGPVVGAAVDILDRPALMAAFSDVEVVFHLAAVITLAHHDDTAWHVNVTGTRNVTEAALAVGARRLVHCSSLDAFDKRRSHWPIDETTPPAYDPVLPVYGRSKAAAEAEVRAVIERGLDAVICNPTGVYGPRHHPGCRLNSVLLRAARGLMPVSIAGSFDMVDARDVAAGLLAAAQRGQRGHNYLLGGHMVVLTPLLRTAAGLRHRPGPLVNVPTDLVKKVIPALEPLGRRLGTDIISAGLIDTLVTAPTVDCTKAQRELDHRPRPAADTVADLIHHAYGKRAHNHTTTSKTGPCA